MATRRNEAGGRQGRRQDRKQGRRQAAQWNKVTRLAMASDDDGLPRAPRAMQALKRLGVSKEALAAAPRITPILKLADGGLAQVFAALRASPDPLIAAFLQKYDGVTPSDRARVSIEAVALSAGLNITALLGAILIALERHAAAIVRILTVTAHPKIVAARIRYGQLPSGERDRTALDTALGLLPNPRGPVFVNKAIYNAGKAAMDEQRLRGPFDDEDEDTDDVPLAAREPDLDVLFPPASRTQERLNAIRQKLLPVADGDKKTIQ
jgi:hypothetical protein